VVEVVEDLIGQRQIGHHGQEILVVQVVVLVGMVRLVVLELEMLEDIAHQKEILVVLLLVNMVLLEAVVLVLRVQILLVKLVLMVVMEHLMFIDMDQVLL
tara:strand:- start:3 stop:302 length:300 start_codon:yes stop_codon:yes gene_type:complete